MRQIIKDILIKEGDITIVGEADNGADAVERYKELQPDIVTLDIVMEDSNGVTALQNIMEFNKNAIVIMITSIGQEKYVKQCLDLGAKGFIIKPFDEDDVLRTVRNAASLISK
jgi:two-component system chemotaxis response regulator CheY